MPYNNWIIESTKKNRFFPPLTDCAADSHHGAHLDQERVGRGQGAQRRHETGGNADDAQSVAETRSLLIGQSLNGADAAKTGAEIRHLGHVRSAGRQGTEESG